MAASQTTAAVPVRPAATVMIVDDRPDLHVLLLRRRAASQFVPGMDVFPGGGVDAHDGAPEGAPVDLDDAGASARLGIARGGLAYWAAATRETYEEAGLRLAIGALHYAAHWITPPGPPRRYDTRFFLAAPRARARSCRRPRACCGSSRAIRARPSSCARRRARSPRPTGACGWRAQAV